MIGCIIQARMGSSRLPGKIMMDLDGKNCLLDYVLNQLSYSKLIDKIDVSIKYNLDLNNLFLEINKKYLDAK